MLSNFNAYPIRCPYDPDDLDDPDKDLERDFTKYDGIVKYIDESSASSIWTEVLLTDDNIEHANTVFDSILSSYKFNSNRGGNRKTNREKT